MKVNNGNKVAQNLSIAHAAVTNPASAFIDGMVNACIAAIVPFPVLREFAILFKKALLWMVLSIVVALVGLFFFLFSLLAAPTGNVTVNDLLQFLPGAGEAVLSQEQIRELQHSLAAGFSDTEIPIFDPFGGSFAVTAGFHDLSYYSQFNMVHTGIDLVPGQGYSSNEVYRQTGQVIVFATMNGSASSYTDSYGALTVDVVNDGGTHKTVYKHLKQIISGGGQVRAGQPIGVMGSTGFSTGEHLHYEVRVNQGGSWIAVNPAGYF